MASAKSNALTPYERQQARANRIRDIGIELNERAKVKSDVTLPSRKELPDGSVNPDYNPRLDPGSNEFQPPVYFEMRPEVEVYVLEDIENPQFEEIAIRVAGHTEWYDCNELQIMPIDFAEAAILAGLAKLPKKREDRRRRRG